MIRPHHYMSYSWELTSKEWNKPFLWEMEPGTEDYCTWNNQDGAAQTIDDQFENDCRRWLLFLHVAPKSFCKPPALLVAGGRGGESALGQMSTSTHPPLASIWNKENFPFHQPGPVYWLLVAVSSQNLHSLGNNTLPWRYLNFGFLCTARQLFHWWEYHSKVYFLFFVFFPVFFFSGLLVLYHFYYIIHFCKLKRGVIYTTCFRWLCSGDDLMRDLSYCRHQTFLQWELWQKASLTARILLWPAIGCIQTPSHVIQGPFVGVWHKPHHSLLRHYHGLPSAAFKFLLMSFRPFMLDSVLSSVALCLWAATCSGSDCIKALEVSLYALFGAFVLIHTIPSA